MSGAHEKKVKGRTWGFGCMFPHKSFKFGISKNAIFYVILRSFQQMNTKENAVVGCLVYPSLVLSVPSIQCEERDK